MGELGLLDDTGRKTVPGRTFLGLMKELAQAASGADVRAAVASRLGLEAGFGHHAAPGMAGPFRRRERSPSRRAPPSTSWPCPMIERLRYEAGERDMVVLQHEFLTGRSRAGPRGSSRRSSTSAFRAATPPCPAPSACPRRSAPVSILEGRIGQTGVHVPVHPEIYGPILEELEALGIRFEEKRRVL